MKAGLKTALFALMFGLMMVNVKPVKAHCTQCPVAVASNSVDGGNAASENAGILFLIAAPFIAASIGGFVWYRNFRRKKIVLHIRDEKLHLN